MSLEDLDLDFLSDESDYESEKSLSNDEKDDDISNYLDLVYLHSNLMCFQQIYNNNAIIDNESMENGDGLSFNSVGSELALIWDQLDTAGSELVLNAMNGVLEDNSSSSTSSSSLSSAVCHEDGTSPNSADSVPSYIQDFVPLYEEVTSTSSSSSSENADVVDGQMTN
ncbi:hypothetical protein L3Q82_021213, partial [Scortum barcoo]